MVCWLLRGAAVTVTHLLALLAVLAVHVQSAKCKVQSAKYEVRSTKCKVARLEREQIISIIRAMAVQNGDSLLLGQMRIDPNLEVSCAVKPAVYLTVSTSGGVGGADSGTAHGIRSKLRPSGCQVVDVHIHSPAPDMIEYITFRNYYTHSITILFRSKDLSNDYSDDTGTKSWRLCVRDFQLMKNCHCAQGGQNWVILNQKHFLNNPTNVKQLRMILKQPSPHWREFGIRDFRCFQKAEPKSILLCTRRMGMGPQQEQDTTVEHMCTKMERMLDIGSKVRTAEKLKQQGTGGLTTMSPITKDPKLPYELNLLSYD